MLGLTRSTALQKRAIQFGTRIANKNVCGQAVLDDSVDFASVVHPDAVQPPHVRGQQGAGGDERGGGRKAGGTGDAGASGGGGGGGGTGGSSPRSSAASPRQRHGRGDASLPATLSKKRGTWASARAVPDAT